MLRIAILFSILSLILGFQNDDETDNYSIFGSSRNRKLIIKDDYIDKNTTEILAGMNFRSETHEVITEDGFVLVLIRIVNPYIGSRIRSRMIPVLVLHGILLNSDFFLTSGFTSKLSSSNILYNEHGQPTSCLTSGHVLASSFVLALANCGYDVWLGNFRGNYYSRKNLRLTSGQEEYWNFTLDTLSEIDLPDMIDYILLTTGQSSLAYIGYSMGTTTMFQLLAEHPEYSSRIDTFVAIAPVVQESSNIGPLIKVLAPLGLGLASLDANALYLPTEELAHFRRMLVKYYCRIRLFLPTCELISNMVLGFGQTVPELVPQFLGHAPDTVSAKLLAHYAQRIESDFRFAKFDYGELNHVVYGRKSPPCYNISHVDHPRIVLISGTNDTLAFPVNVKYLVESLPQKPISYVIEGYNHIDYVMGKNASVLVVKWLLERFQTLYS